MILGMGALAVLSVADLRRRRRQQRERADAAIHPRRRARHPVLQGHHAALSPREPCVRLDLPARRGRRRRSQRPGAVRQAPARSVRRAGPAIARDRRGAHVRRAHAHRRRTARRARAQESGVRRARARDRHRGHRDRPHRGAARAATTRAGRGRGARGGGGEEPFPGDDEPRDPHADERRAGHDRPARRHRAAAGADSACSTVAARQSVALLTILDDILDFSKIEAGKLELEHVPVALRPLIDEVCASLGPQATARNVRIGVQVGGDVAAGDHRRSGAAAADPAQPRGQRRQVHRRDGRVDVQARVDSSATAAVRARYRHRHDGRGDGAAVRALRAGRRGDDAPLRRHRPGPEHREARWRS